MRRADVLRWTRRIALSVLGFVAFLLLGGVSFEQWARWSGDRRYPPVGELVEVEGRRSHLNCAGEGTPTVVLEAGWSGGGSLDWILVQPSLSEITRTCSYDRAGIMWSERRKGPRDGNRMAEELHELLKVAGEVPPYVMVGHSLGGPLVRVFDSKFPGEVRGFVFVDTSHPEQVERIRVPSSEAHSSLWWLRFRAMTGIYRLHAPPPAYGLPSDAAEMVRGLMPRTVAALLDEDAAINDILEAAGAAGSVGDRPLVVLTASQHAQPGMSQAAIVDMQRAWVTLQLELASLSTNSVQRTVEGSHHYIQLARPEEVLQAIQRVVTAVRNGSRLNQAETEGAFR